NPGLYLVNVNGVLGSFSVLESTAVEGSQGAPPSTLIDKSTSSFSPAKNTNWWLMGGIYAVDAILLAIIIVWLLKRRKKTRETEGEEIILEHNSQTPNDNKMRK
ncbi:MAG: LPXTG cell wall anchor domain-containing protein, partial [Dehalococcoidia bacterium]